MSSSLSLSKSAPVSRKSSRQQIPVFLAGIGAVGGTLLTQIRELEHSSFDFRILGLCNSRYLCWQPGYGSETEELKASSQHTAWDSIVRDLASLNKPVIFIDATGSEEVARYYEYLLTKRVHIVTPSKRANTFDQAYYDRLIQLSSGGEAHYRFETTVGAGLPVLHTLQALLESGDEIIEISGVVSGTMTYIFNQLQNGKSFSSIIESARSLGYSEPDPRDDLSGEDVARKFLILARSCGYKLERSDLEVESLVPEELVNLPLEDFLNELSSYDDHWKNRNSRALVNGKRLRYTGSFSKEGASVGIREVASDSPLGSLKGTDNLIQIRTRRYKESPVVIQGPGAGKEVTAAGILSDLIQIGKNIQLSS